jgi:hypothetical protein
MSNALQKFPMPCHYTRPPSFCPISSEAVLLTKEEASYSPSKGEGLKEAYLQGTKATGRRELINIIENKQKINDLYPNKADIQSCEAVLLTGA